MSTLYTPLRFPTVLLAKVHRPFDTWRHAGGGPLNQPRSFSTLPEAPPGAYMVFTLPEKKK